MKQRQKNSTTLPAVLKTVTVHALSFSMLYAPTAYAQNDLLNGAAALLNGVQGFTQQMQQQRQQAMAQAQMQSQMQALQPQPIPSQYFPRCAVSKAVSDFPEGACDNPPAPGDAAGAAQLQSFKGLAVSYESFFENMLAENQNSGFPQGPQCLQEEAARADAAIQDKINALQALIGKVNKEIQAFDQANRKVKEQMEDVRSELYGGAVDQEDRNKNLLTQFSGSCQEYFAGNNAQVRGRGFSGLRDQMDTKNAEAGRFKNNSKGYEAELSRMVQGLEKEIKRGGLSVLKTPQSIQAALSESGSTTVFGSMRSVLEAKSRNVQRNLEELQKDLADVGFRMDISDFDGNFQEKFKNFSSGSLNYFKKEAVSNCVSGSDRTLGGGLSTQQILDGLRHRNFGNSGPTQTLANYKDALKTILDSDAFIQDKMNSIAALDQQYGVGNIFIQTKRAGQTDYPTPYGLYQSQIEYCEAQVSQNETFSTDSGKRSQVSSSYADRIQRAERALKKALNIEQEFVADLSVAVINRVKNCEGIEYKEESCIMGSSGDSSALSTEGNPNFCIGHANTCSTKIQSCFKEADTIVKKKQQEMATLAAQHNAQVSNLVARQEFFLNQIKAQVVADAESIKQTFPGVSYEFPTDLFVELPEEMMSPKFGVALRGGESSASLVEDLPRKMEGLVNILKQQKVAANKFWSEYVGKQKAGMVADAKKWTRLKDQCNGAIDGYNQAVAQANQAEAEALGQSAGFCQKFDALATNPMAGCGDADKLFEDSMNVTQGLAAANLTRQAALEYKNFCNQANNEGEEGQETSTEEEQFIGLSETCRENPDGNDFETLLREDTLSQMPTDLSSHRTLIENYLKGEEDSANIPRSVRRTPYFNNVVRPAQTVLNGTYQRPSYPTPVEGDDGKATAEDFAEFIGVSASAYESEYSEEEWNNKGFCERFLLHARIEAAKDAKSESTGSDFEDKANEEHAEIVIKSNAPRNAARAIASIDASFRRSDSGRIGERMRGVPCMAQQGFNGSQGFNLNSFDAGQLGSDAASVINSITGGR
jgi:hypothetical protein